jgi:hypothetical protein
MTFENRPSARSARTASVIKLELVVSGIAGLLNK